MKLYLWVAVFAAAMLSGCSSPLLTNPSADFSKEIALNDSQLQGLARAKADYGSSYTFVVSRNGHWGYASGTDPSSVRTALGECQKYANQPCRIHSAGADFTQSRYARFSAESQAALRSLEPVADKNYHDETTDWKVAAPPLALKARKSMEGPTPLTLPGIRTIRTAEFVAMIRKNHPVMIDAEGYYNEEGKTIPNAFVIDWIGAPRLKNETEEAGFVNRLDLVMRSVQPDKTQPLVVFCESSSCWYSAHAALRLRELGYNNVLWYRGGKFAWKDAGLPSVPEVPYATISYYNYWPRE